jgi:spermidine/putrescine transport system substrate-binding protein
MGQPHPRTGAKTLKEALERRLGRPVSRREFLRASAVVAATPGLSAILAACGGDPRKATGQGPSGSGFEVATPDNPVTLPAGTPIADGLPSETGATLQLFNWTYYIWRPIVQRFCDAEGCDFDITTFDNMEEGVSKLQTGELKIDVFFPTYDHLGKLVHSELLQPLNHSYIPNIDNVWETFQNPFYDQGWQYSIPYTTYTTGIEYRRDLISDDQIRAMTNPYEVLWDPQYSGKVGIYNSYRDAIAMALLKNGITDINTGSAADIEIARNDLIAMVDAVNIRTSINGAYAKLPKGEYDVHQAWSGDSVAAWGYVNTYVQSEYENVGYWFPDDRKGPVDNDLIAIPASAEHPVLAHKFLNFIIDFKNSMDNFSWNGYQPPLVKADVSALTTTEGLYSKNANWAEPAMYVSPWMPDAVVRQEDFDIGYRLHELAPESDQLWLDAWQEFKAGA